MKRLLLLVANILLPLSPLSAETIHVYGPGGPAPAMKEAAAVFGKANGVEVVVTAGPTSEWSAAMKSDGDVVYSGSEAMMSEFVSAFAGILLPDTVRPLYMRPAGILVRPGNPKDIRGFSDLLRPGMRIAVVDGAGQQGMWEDIAGRRGDIATVRAFRTNVVLFARNTALALKGWKADPTIDAWLTFPIWAEAKPSVADVVALDADHIVYRDAGVVLTVHGQDNAHAQAFVRFLSGPRAAAIFRKWGWRT